jgi:hypothetical protein
MNWVEVLQTINLSLYLFGFIVFLTIIVISKKIKSKIRIFINLSASIALITWFLALLNLIDFDFYALLSFKILIICLIFSIFFKLIVSCSSLIKVSYFIVMLFNITTFILTSYGYFNDNFTIVLSLSLFSTYSIILLFFQNKKKLLIP